MTAPRRTLHFYLLSISAAFSWAVACSATRATTGSTTQTTSGTGGGGGSGGQGGGPVFGTGGKDSGPTCSGLACQIHACPTGLKTTISGTIYDPAGKDPLYGVVAYVPNSKPTPISRGASCFSCGDLYTGDPIAAALSDAGGHFTIPYAPDGADIPLVIQIGKWRRQFVIPHVALCSDTPIPDGMLTLPKSSSEGDLPDIAVVTGFADTLECLIGRMGVDKSEYVPGASDKGHVHIFASVSSLGLNGANTNPPAPLPEKALWDSDQDIMPYDMVLLSCEGAETANPNQQVLFDYTSAGGRVFAEHLNYAFFYTGPFSTQNVATWIPMNDVIGTINASVVISDWNGKPFVRGQAFHDWLVNVNALTNDMLPIAVARHNADVTVSNTPSQNWLVVNGNATEPQTFTFDTPFGVDAGQQCGRVVFTDMHVTGASNDYGGDPTTGIVPSGCVDADLSPEEKALEFNLFDLSSCVTPDNAPQPLPVTK